MQHRKRKRATAPKRRVDLDLALYSIPGLPRSCVQGQTFCRPIHEQEDEKSNTNSRVSLALRDYLVWPRLGVSPSVQHHEPGAPCDLIAHFKVEFTGRYESCLQSLVTSAAQNEATGREQIFQPGTQTTKKRAVDECKSEGMFSFRCFRSAFFKTEPIISLYARTVVENSMHL